MLEWAYALYEVPEERFEILGCRPIYHIHFSYMSLENLREVLTCNDFDHELASKLVNEVLWFKADAPRRRRALAAKSTHKRFMKRD